MIWKLISFPRIDLFTKPTPVEKLFKLSSEYSVDFFIKRDDVMEPWFGGNKARKLEFIFGEIVSKKYNAVITRGSYYSNHVRLTTIIARKLGIEPYIVTYPPNPETKLFYQGNVLLNKIFGANIIEVRDNAEADREMFYLKNELEKQGYKPYIIPVGGSTPLGVLGYALAVFELMNQLKSMNVKPKYIVHATGTGTTQAGLILGLKLLGVEDVRVIGINTEKKELEENLVSTIIELIQKTVDLLKVSNMNISENDVLIYSEYTFGGYGVVNNELISFIKNIARKEGLLLDPVYTGKAFYGLLDLIEKGEIPRGEKIVFIHTGGLPILFQMFDKFIE